MKRDKICFFTIADDRYYYPVGTPKLISSFRKFHRDLDLIVFRQDMIDKIFSETKVNFYNAKPTFAKLLEPYYEKVVNIDADTIILGRLDEVIDGDWEVGAVWNKNDYEDATIEGVTAEMYVQAGMVGSTNKVFWDIWEMENKNAMKYLRQENDILNKIWYDGDKVESMKRVIWDKDKNYLGCKSLGRESEFYMEDNKVMCRKEQVKSYHWARGGQAMPKLQFDKLPFTEDVRNFMEYCGSYGTSEHFSFI